MENVCATVKQTSCTAADIFSMVETMPPAEANALFECISESNIDSYIAFLTGLKNRYCTEYRFPNRYMHILLSSTPSLTAATFAFVVLSWPKYETELYDPILQNFRAYMQDDSSLSSIFLHSMFCLSESQLVTEDCLETCAIASHEVYTSHKYETTQYLHSALVSYIRMNVPTHSFTFRGFNILLMLKHSLTEALHKLTILSTREIVECMTRDSNPSKTKRNITRIMTCIQRLYSSQEGTTIVKLLSESMIFANFKSDVRMAALQFIAAYAMDTHKHCTLSTKNTLLRVMEILLDVAMLDRADCVRITALQLIQNALLCHASELESSALIQVLMMKCRDKSSKVRGVAFDILSQSIGPQRILSVLDKAQAEIFISHAFNIFPPRLALPSHVEFILEISRVFIETSAAMNMLPEATADSEHIIAWLHPHQNEAISFLMSLHLRTGDLLFLLKHLLKACDRGQK